MLMTREMDYALRIVRALYRDGQLSAASIAQREQVPKAITLKILKQLHTAGLVDSRRGPSGGYLLQRDCELPEGGLSVREPSRGGLRPVPGAVPHPGDAGRRDEKNTIERNFPGKIGNLTYHQIKEEVLVCCTKPHRGMRSFGQR